MGDRIRSHLTYANVISTLCLFLLLGGGTAVALNGANTVQSDDLGPGAQVKAPDVAANAVNGADVTNESLTGQDVKNQSGVDTCTHGTARFGELCVRVANEHHDYFSAGDLCEALELRLPSLGEAQSLARNHDLPNAAENEPFWTEEFYKDGTNFFAFTVTDGNSVASVSFVTDEETVCV